MESRTLENESKLNYIEALETMVKEETEGESEHLTEEEKRLSGLDERSEVNPSEAEVDPPKTTPEGGSMAGDQSEQNPPSEKPEEVKAQSPRAETAKADSKKGSVKADSEKVESQGPESPKPTPRG